MTLLIALVAALAPLNPLPIVGQRELSHARDRWLQGVLALGTLWLAFHGAHWLALIALWHLITWHDESSRSSVLLWAGIGATWGLLRTLPLQAFTYMPWVWLTWGVVQSAMCLYGWLKLEWPVVNRVTLGKRSKGSFGSPVLTGIYLAIIAPFAPWWAWILLAPGIWLTNSWTAAFGLALGAAWLFPGAAIYLGAAMVGAVGLLFASKYQEEPPVVGKATWRNQRLFEGLPRGDSIDGWYGRWAGDRLLLYHWWHSPHRWVGWGPGTAPKAMLHWNSRIRRGLELPNGSCHFDLGETVYEMGALGLLAVIAFLVPIALQLRLGDPWSAAWMVTAVISLGHWPLRHPAIGLLFLVISARVVL